MQEVKTDNLIQPTISVRNLHKAYGDKKVLKGINLDVFGGELFGFIGKNGIGKTTAIDCMIGAKRFDEGSVTIGGYDITKFPVEAKFTFGYVSSEPNCYEIMTGYEYLEFIASIFGLGEKEFRSNYKYLCGRLNLSETELSEEISGYSHGTKQKLCLVASILHSPKIWILDEPTIGLDVIAVEQLKKMMREYANHGNTVFVASHNIELVSRLCDRVAIVNNGVVETLYDLNKLPNLRLGLNKLFIDTYGG